MLGSSSTDLALEATGFMRARFGLRRAAIGLGFAAALAAMQAGASLAGVQDSVFFVSPDGSDVAFDVRDVTRREVLSRLLRSEAVELEWGDSALAEERITGAFKGTIEAVLQRLLAQTDYVVIYANDGARPRIARLIILGKGGAPSQTIELPKPIPGMITGTDEAPKPTPGVPLTLMPPPPAVHAPQPLIAAPPASAALPLAPPPSTAPHPLAVPTLPRSR